MTSPLELPALPLEVPAGTPVHLAADDWADCRDLTSGTQVVVVSALGTGHVGDGWTRVVGHRPQCEYGTSDEHPPCLEVRVRTAVLARYGCPP
ncbi:hypothetical protein [Micromonospora sp. NPDC007230]|uniref:hypothetical protein n=1 Tax=Micromonospora sp. NPDC007230 TaxID=3364237 RepID=UPI003674ABA5